MPEIRKAKSEDAVGLIELFKKLDEETTFMLFEHGERIITVEQQIARLNAFGSSQTETMFVAESAGSLVGFSVAVGGSANRNRHSVHIVAGVLRNYWNQGFGQALMRAVEIWAIEKGMHRLELSVIADNAKAIALYEKSGFEREGIKRDALRVDDKYVNEIYMSKLI